MSNINKVLGSLIYNRLYNFLEKNSVIYNLRFGFRQKYSTPNALIHLIVKLRELINSENVACGKLIDLQKAFGAVDYEVLSQKLKHCAILGVASN